MHDHCPLDAQSKGVQVWSLDEVKGEKLAGREIRRRQQSIATHDFQGVLKQQSALPAGSFVGKKVAITHMV